MTDAFPDLSRYKFISVFPAEELPPGERLFLEIGDHSIVVLNIAGQYYAVADLCTHDNGPLGSGDVEGHAVICPRHGARFDVRTGQALRLPAVKPIPAYPVRVTDGSIEVGILEEE